MLLMAGAVLCSLVSWLRKWQPSDRLIAVPTKKFSPIGWYNVNKRIKIKSILSVHLLWYLSGRVNERTGTTKAKILAVPVFAVRSIKLHSKG